jgi:hypothetical protein
LGWRGGNVVEGFVSVENNRDVAEDVTLKINFMEEEGRLTKLLAPSAFVGYSKKNAGEILRKEIDHFGLIRISIEPVLSNSLNLKDYVARLSQYDKAVQEIAQKDGNVILLIAKVPRWFSSNPSTRATGSGWRVFAASPPKDYSKWAEVVYHTVDHFNNKLGLDLFYEIWSEPDNPNKHFWLGTQKQFLELYKHTVLGAKRADPKAKVVAPSVLSWYGSIDSNVKQGEKPDLRTSLIYDLIRFSAKTPLPELNMARLPLDFISYHIFQTEPSDIHVSVGQINKWLEQFEYQNTRLIISEWNGRDHTHDSLDNAAYYLAMLNNMYKNGIYLQSFASLQDFHSGMELKPPKEFHQDFGLITREFAIKKPVYNAFCMLNQLSDTRIKTSVGNSQTIEAIATKDTDKVSILLWNYTPPPIKAVLRYLKSLGYSKDSFKKLNISKRDIKKFIKERKSPKNLSLPKDVKNDLNEARKLFLKQKKLLESCMAVRLAIENMPYDSFKYERYLIDSTHSNSFYHYEKAKAEGKSEEQAIKEAMAHQHLEKVEEKILKKNDNIPTIPLEPYSTSLIILEKL